MSPKKQVPSVSFPGGSKKRINRAGSSVRDGNDTLEDLQAIEEWRAAHRAVLNTFQAILRMRTRGTGISVAQRHKRRNTIFDKLRRLPGMQLSRMDDVAGCRLIFRDVDQLNEFRNNFHAARFDHVRRNDIDKYNYIRAPKSTGYRGIHDIYEYHVRSKMGESLRGLYVEIQYRTLVQHAWATANEVVGFVTDSQPKFQKGDTRYVRAMSLASELLARSYEGLRGAHAELDDKEVVREFVKLDKEIRLLSTLKGINSTNQSTTSKRNSILIFSDTGSLTIKTYRDATEALEALFDLEKEHPEWDIVLVRADSSDDVRLAFRNYFSDASEFIRMVEEGCAKLSGKTTFSRRRAL